MKSIIENPYVLYILAFAISLAVSALLTPVLRALALRFQILDQPHSRIKTHRKATPYLGGLAVWAGWLASLTVLRAFTHFPTGTLHSLRGIVLGSAVILMLGLLDDILPKGLGFKMKFLFQALAALIVLLFDIRMHFVSPYPVAMVLSLIWIIGVTNAFNIIDIMDGLSSGIAAIAGIAFLLIALPTEHIYVNFCAAALAGGCVGFIPYNLSRSRKIFMGDAGSLTIGFILASISMGTSYTSINEIGLLAPILILAIPVYDTLLVMYLRMRRGMSPFLGSKDHFALRLEAMGFSRRQVLYITYAASGVLAFGAYLVTRLPLAQAIILFFIVFAAAVAISYRLSLIEVE